MPCMAQKESLHKVFQYKNSEDSLIAFFDKYSMKNDTDSIMYAVLLPPMGCPRCEGLIDPFFIKLKRKVPQARMSLFAFYPLRDAANNYLKNRNFRVKKKYLFTGDVFKNFIGYSTTILQVPIFVKFDTKNGILLNQLSSLGANLNDLTLENFVKGKTDCFIDKNSDKLGGDIDGIEEPIRLTLFKNKVKDNFELNMLKFDNEEIIH